MFEFRRRQLDMKVADLLRIIIQKDLDKMELMMELFGYAPSARYENSDEYLQQRVNFIKLRNEILDGRKNVP